MITKIIRAESSEEALQSVKEIYPNTDYINIKKVGVSKYCASIRLYNPEEHKGTYVPRRYRGARGTNNYGDWNT